MNPIRTALATTLAFSTATMSAPAAAHDRMFWEKLPRVAFHEVFAYYCAPAQVELASIGEPAPTGDAQVVYEGLFVGTYGGSCRDFYFREVDRRIDRPTQQGLIVVDR